jgi:DNA-directed DNA polymerase III PolC
MARLEMELRVIQQRGFADYFLIVDELVGFAREQGIPSVGRGSAASSIVAYALGITSVDPLRHDLPFERFLSPERRDCPDIDLDLDWRGRDAVIRHAYATYGEDRVAMIATHVTFQARAAVRDVARTRGLPPDMIGRVTAHLPHRLGGILTGRTPPPELAGADLGTAPWRDVLRMALALDGLPRHLGLHVGGIVIGDGPLADALPLERSALGRIATQFEMHGVEATGLVKIDLLGNRALAVVADVVRDVTAREGVPPDLDAVPEDDEAAGALLRTGRTLGCFQVESPAMRNLVVRMDAHTQRDAMIALSLIRPGPAGSGMKDAYVRRRRGEEAVPAVHERVDPLFASTYGVMLYQEDTLRVAAAVAGFDLGQADHLRRALSKKREPEDLPALAIAFRRGATAHGVPQAVTEQVWGDIQRFSAYAYNKAHAATYARISWQGLYLKARYPASYLASVLRNAAGFYAPRVYVEEARRLGCFIAPPCVNASAEGPVGRERTLRLGLGQIKGLDQATPARLVEVREAGGPYLSLTDLLLRTDLTRAEAERLVLAGAVDGFDRPRGELLWMLALDFERYAEARREGRDRRTLFGPMAMLPPRRHIPVPRQYTAEELLALEIETLGLTVTCHPSDPWQAAADEAGALPVGDLAAHVGQRVRIAAWIVSDRRVRIRAEGRSKGRYMKFAMLEDASGSVEVTLFPRVYEQVGHRLTDAGPYLVTGRVRDDHGSLTLEALDVQRLEGRTA